MGRAAVYERICIATEEELGIRINPHAFRHIVATGVAIAVPEGCACFRFFSIIALRRRCKSTTILPTACRPAVVTLSAEKPSAPGTQRQHP